MTTKEYCLSSPTIAYSPILGGIEIKGRDVGIDDFLFTPQPKPTQPQLSIS
jgi:hypothetical protein